MNRWLNCFLGCEYDSDHIFEYMLERAEALSASASLQNTATAGSTAGQQSVQEPPPLTIIKARESTLACIATDGKGLKAEEFQNVWNEQKMVYAERECSACIETHRYSWGARCDETNWYCAPKARSANKVWETELSAYPRRCKPPGWCGELANLGFSERFMSPHGKLNQNDEISRPS